MTYMFVYSVSVKYTFIVSFYVFFLIIAIKWMTKNKHLHVHNL